MEESLVQIGASAMLVGENEHAAVLAATSPQAKQDLTNEAADFVRLNQLAASLKLGEISQALVVGEGDVRLAKKHGSNVGVVAASNIGQVFLADTLIDKLLERRN